MSVEQMLQVPVKDAGGDDRGTLSLDPSRIDRRVRYRLLKEAVVMYQANRRAGTHATKTRGFIAGSTHKPYRQKGTGRARAGSRKSPLWRGGGVIFGPHPRDYSYSIHKKQRRLAIRSALLSKFRDGEVLVVEGLSVPEPKTRIVHQALRALGVEGSCLVGTLSHDPNLVLAARNIPGVLVAKISDFNALDILKSRTVVLTRDAFEAIASAEAASGTAAGGDTPGGDTVAEATAGDAESGQQQEGDTP